MVSSRELSPPITAVTSGHTPGPWEWMGSDRGIYLATTHSGRRYVMGFRRMGLQGAQPVFSVNNRMVPAADLVKFEVGDRDVRGFAAGKLDETVYRCDVRGIDAADARLIAAAPDLLEALRLVRQSTEWSCMERDTQDAVEAAIAKATGQ